MSISRRSEQSKANYTRWEGAALEPSALEEELADKFSRQLSVLKSNA
jgi:hypothetical protein